MPDTNVLLYAVNRDAPQQPAAERWLADGFDTPAGVGLSWVVLLGFVRIATRHGIFTQPLSIEQSLRCIDQWLGHPAARVLDPDKGHAALLGRLLLGAGAAGNLTTDAHVAALAIEHGATLGSFDRDFGRFAGLDWQLLGA